jgi:hypothetical protein
MAKVTRAENEGFIVACAQHVERALSNELRALLAQDFDVAADLAEEAEEVALNAFAASRYHVREFCE